MLLVHRGSHEVGGSCVELRADGKSLLLDLGLPLSANGPGDVRLPDVPGLADGSNPNLLGVVISHPHQDHCGLLEKVHPGVPVFMGRQAHALLNASAWFTRTRCWPGRVTDYQDGRQFKVGPFTITPTLNDHSAFDSYSLLVEAEGKSVLYTGDFRMHGRKSGWLRRLLVRLPGMLDALIVEGTCVGRMEKGRPEMERELEERILSCIRDTRGIVLVWFSGQNIDRFVTFFRAAKRAGRMMVVDLYMASILDALRLSSVPSPRDKDLLVYLPWAMKQRVKHEQRFDLVQPYYGRRLYPEALAQQAGKLVVMFRPSMRRDLEKADCLDGARVVYSLWHGYLEQDSTGLEAWCHRRGIEFEQLHTSGHASALDLRRFVRLLAPRKVVPVHTFEPELFRGFCENVVVADDGREFEI